MGLEEGRREQPEETSVETDQQAVDIEAYLSNGFIATCQTPLMFKYTGTGQPCWFALRLGAGRFEKGFRGVCRPEDKLAFRSKCSRVCTVYLDFESKVYN